MDQETFNQASAAVEQSAPPPSITDLVPTGADSIAGRAASPVSAAVLRIYQAIAHAVGHRDGEPIPDDESGLLVIFLRLRSADRAGQRQLWREARSPLKLYEAFVDWMNDTPLREFAAAVQENQAALQEMNRASEIIGGGEEENPTKASATGSP
jgi:hypothetical protein